MRLHLKIVAYSAAWFAACLVWYFAHNRESVAPWVGLIGALICGAFMEMMLSPFRRGREKAPK